MGKISTVYLDADTLKLIEDYQINVSGLIRESIKEKYQDITILTKRIEDMEKELENMKNMKEVLQVKNVNIDEIIETKPVKKMLKDMFDQLAKGFDLDAIFRRFKNENFIPNLTKTQFLELMGKVKDGKI